MFLIRSKIFLQNVSKQIGDYLLRCTGFETTRQLFRLDLYHTLTTESLTYIDLSPRVFYDILDLFHMYFKHSTGVLFQFSISNASALIFPQSQPSQSLLNDEKVARSPSLNSFEDQWPTVEGKNAFPDYNGSSFLKIVISRHNYNVWGMISWLSQAPRHLIDKCCIILETPVIRIMIDHPWPREDLDPWDCQIFSGKLSTHSKEALSLADVKPDSPSCWFQIQLACSVKLSRSQASFKGLYSRVFNKNNKVRRRNLGELTHHHIFSSINTSIITSLLPRKISGFCWTCPTRSDRWATQLQLVKDLFNATFKRIGAAHWHWASRWWVWIKIQTQIKIETQRQIQIKILTQIQIHMKRFGAAQ